jgi:hypothetical protein
MQNYHIFPTWRNFLVSWSDLQKRSKITICIICIGILMSGAAGARRIVSAQRPQPPLQPLARIGIPKHRKHHAFTLCRRYLCLLFYITPTPSLALMSIMSWPSWLVVTTCTIGIWNETCELTGQPKIVWVKTSSFNGDNRRKVLWQFHHMCCYRSVPLRKYLDTCSY